MTELSLSELLHLCFRALSGSACSFELYFLEVLQISLLFCENKCKSSYFVSLSEMSQHVAQLGL